MRRTDRRKPLLKPALLLALLSPWALASPTASADYLISLGLEADDQDSRAVSMLGSFATGANSWVTGSLSKSRSEGELFDIDTLYGDLSFDHHFDPIGLRIGIGYWGDPDLLDSNNVFVGLYLRNEHGSLSLDYEGRAFDLTVRSPLLDEPRRTGFDADGLGLSARLSVNDALSVFINGMSYSYSRDISLQPNVSALRFFSLSRLSTINSLIDTRLSGGLEWSIGTRLIDLRASSWKTAVFGDRVDSVGLGLLTPFGEASDIELRLSLDDSDVAGRVTVFSAFLYFYGR